MNARIKKSFNTVILVLFIAVGAGILGLTPFGTYLEEELGLSWLFKLRGSVSPSEEVIIVSIDKTSAEVLHLPDDPEKWSRSKYAELIEKINQYNPAVIAINITFSDTRDSESDHYLAEVMGREKNIILTNYLKQSITKSKHSLNKFVFEQYINPIYMLEQAAVGIAPFPLPKTAETIKRFWPYTNNEEGIATFPIAIFDCFLFKQSYYELFDLLSQLELDTELPDLTGFRQPTDKFNSINAVKKVKTAILSDFQGIDRLEYLINGANYSEYKKSMLASWFSLLKSTESIYLNHFGTAGAITTIPFYRLLENEDLDPATFRNKVIMVGYSENIEPEKNQGIYTVFSETYTATTSPIEIAATAVANLISNTQILPLRNWLQFIVIFVWGLILLGLSQLWSYKLALILMSSLSLGYIGIASLIFTLEQVWMPLVIPVFLQLPFALLLSSLRYFRKIKTQQLNVHSVFSQFIPNEVVNKITYQSNINSLNEYGEIIFGVCMSTDADKYTTLSETISPEKLSVLMNSYYGVMFPLVRQFKGIISDVIGDAMLAIWATQENETRTRSDACRSALELIRAIEEFNNTQPFLLPTRIGLHFGEIRLGNVGADGHYEYRAIGDTVNTATRIEPLNKILGTQILVSSTVIKDLSGFLTREMGHFSLKGKKKSILLYELIVSQEDIQHQVLIDSFIKALKLFQNYQWDEALTAWLALQSQFPNDGPTQFYIKYLLQKTSFSLVPDKSHQSQPVIVDIGNITTAIANYD